jgi:hypothetical protein
MPLQSLRKKWAGKRNPAKGIIDNNSWVLYKGLGL